MNSIMSSNHSFTCYHCASSILPGDLIEAQMAGVKRQFCCAGCMAIAQTIHGEGLEVFYARRSQSSDKPAAYLAGNEIPDNLKPYDDPSLQARFTRPYGDVGDVETTLRLEKIRCAACVWLCEQHLRRIAGVKDVQINYVTQKAIVRYSPEKTSLARLLFEIERIGYEAWPFEPLLSFERSKKERRQLLTRLGVAMLGMMQVMMYVWPSYVGAKIANYWAKYLGRFANGPSRWFSGMLWGLVPCGLVYGVLPLAFLSGDVLTGATIMLAFGLGTLPNLLLISKFSAVLTQFGQYAWVRYLAASLLFIGAGFGLYRAWTLPEVLLKGGFCLS